MRDHVAVGVPGETARVVEADAAEHERNAVRECVRIDTEPDPQVAHPNGTCLASRASKTVIVS